MVSVSVVSMDGTVLLEKVTLEPEDYVQALRAKVWMKCKDPNFDLVTQAGTLLSDIASIADSGISDGATITFMKKATASVAGRPVPEELLSFWEFLLKKKVEQRLLELWFLEDFAKMSSETRATFMDQFAACDSIDATGPTRSIPHQWSFTGKAPSGELLTFEWECED
eukprot:CAMPEP_0197655828 /NCGR_PEP_ID=MMETSP1338-20131121/39696_1 /TAXON_ID=43686 ORGANISM="Pelagodinium beii, Strain RCC1491" /NCGR_SAMPLE_ID=MMETSP1338 /ASSEMBLY_ACC=CAM_ASM_000754 /LENGTH=167 /DNA_ID=CAMNT_0043231555 /DNA_START=45 /DNA_END=548 /DNA_ORIENTATION=-